MILYRVRKISYQSTYSVTGAAEALLPLTVVALALLLVTKDANICKGDTTKVLLIEDLDPLTIL